MNVNVIQHLLIAAATWCLMLTTAQPAAAWDAPLSLPNNNVSSMALDPYGFMWVGTNRGLFRFDGYDITAYYHKSGDPASLLNNIVNTLYTDKEGRLWVGTVDGLQRYDFASNSFVTYDNPTHINRHISSLTEHKGTLLVGTAGGGLFSVKDVDNLSLQAEPGYSAPPYMFYSRTLIDHQDHFWFSGNQDSLYRIKPDPHNKKITRMHSPYGEVAVMRNFDGGVVVAARWGLMMFAGGRMDHNHFDLSALRASGAEISCADVAPNGELYVGTLGGGMFRVRPGQRTLEPFQPTQLNADDVANVRSVMADRYGNLWIGTQDKGLLMAAGKAHPFDTWRFAQESDRHGATNIRALCTGEKREETVVLTDNELWLTDDGGKIVSRAKGPKDARCIVRGKDGRLWIGAKNGLYLATPNRGAVERVVAHEGGTVNAITCDDDGHIFYSLRGKTAYCYTPATGQVQQIHLGKVDSDGKESLQWINCMAVVDGKLYVGSTPRFKVYDIKRNRLEKILLNEHVVNAMQPLSDGRVLIGTTTGALLVDPRSGQVETPDALSLLNDEEIYSMTQTTDHKVWIASSTGVWSYDGQQLRHYGYLSSDDITAFTPNAALLRADGQVLMGGGAELLCFNPSRLTNTNATVEAPRLSRLVINGVTEATEAHLADRGGERNVFTAQRFVMESNENNLTLYFTNLDYEDAKDVQYEYRIDGGQWMQTVRSNNFIQLNSLSHKTHSVEVRARLYDIVSESRKYELVIRPPFYLSPLAWALYIVAAIIIAYYVWLRVRRRQRRRQEDEKMKALIDATHDIRTPLTLILSPLHKVMSLTADDERLKEPLQTIERNANRILALVNQILDLRKMDKMQLKLHCKKTDLVDYIGVISKEFEYGLKERGITLEVENNGTDSLPVWIDRQNFGKVINNLFSNAMKFTPEGGEIAVSVGTTDTTDKKGASTQWATVSVADTGVGIAEKDMPKVFERFYQGSTHGESTLTGSGIGLNLCKMITEMHGGRISVAKRRDKQGTVFTVLLPLGNEHLAADMIDDSSEPATTEHKGSAGERVLMVDDDAELAGYIASELSRYYRVTVCHNGREALKELLGAEHDYDIVVTDVMMPEMDGFTLLRMVKSNANICHIPVIVLTSKADVANRLEGLNRGADAYLPKPFDLVELHAQIGNIIGNVRRLRGKFTGAQAPKDIQMDDEKGNDEQLMDRIVACVNANLGDGEFNVEKMCLEVGISRTHLFRKMKEMTGITVAEFIRNIRMEQAARMLREKDFTVTQVGYRCGFNNISHFSTVFKKHFGMTPREYASQGKPSTEDDEA